MARMARIVAPYYPHHITQRGSRRQKTFFCEDDYTYYLELTSEYSRQAKTDIRAYYLMPNHVHLARISHQDHGSRRRIRVRKRRSGAKSVAMATV